MSTVTALLFDLGDTLWHYPNFPPRQAIREETVRRIFNQLRRWGIEPDGDMRYLGRDIRLAVERQTERAFHGDCISPHYPSLCRAAAARFGVALSDAQTEALWEAWNLEGQFYGRQLYPDVLETMAWLRRQGYRIGSVTNRAYSGPRFWQELRELGLTDFFEVVAISCDVGYMKPHPRIFQHAL
ncbi:MAG: HAD family hydrolase, partial [Dehalococcoidia bacterium]